MKKKKLLTFTNNSVVLIMDLNLDVSNLAINQFFIDCGLRIIILQLLSNVKNGSHLNFNINYLINNVFLTRL